MAERCNVDDVGIVRIDDDRADLPRIVEPMWLHVFPPSVDLYIPSPYAMSERMSASPVPT